MFCFSLFARQRFDQNTTTSENHHEWISIKPWQISGGSVVSATSFCMKAFFRLCFICQSLWGHSDFADNSWFVWFYFLVHICQNSWWCYYTRPAWIYVNVCVCVKEPSLTACHIHKSQYDFTFVKPCKTFLHSHVNVVINNKYIVFMCNTNFLLLSKLSVK